MYTRPKTDDMVSHSAVQLQKIHVKQKAAEGHVIQEVAECSKIKAMMMRLLQFRPRRHCYSAT